MESVKQKISRGHKCYICGERFASIHILRKHVNIHKDHDVICDICGKGYSSVWGLKKHKFLHSGVRPFKCDYCERRFSQKCTMTSHIRTVHNPKVPRYFCVTCGKKIRSNSLQCWLCKYENKPLPLHSVSEGSSGSQHQEVCETSATLCKLNDSERKLLNAFVKEPRSSIGILNCMAVACSSTNKLLPETQPGTVKLQSHSCLMCCETFPSLIELRQHISNTHKNCRPFSCGTCGSRFATQLAMENHEATHSEERPFMCMTCKKCYKTQMTLQIHLNTHKEDRPFACKTCKATFKTLMTLKVHSITHIKERPFICKLCGYPFKTLERLRKHIIVHSSERPYKCDTCFKAFRHRGNLGRHCYLHLSQRLFVCHICGKDFAQSCGLKQHKQVHNKNYKAEKTLSCPLCGKTYKLDVMLQRHIINHR